MALRSLYLYHLFSGDWTQYLGLRLHYQMILSLPCPGLPGLSESREKYNRTISALCVNTQYSDNLNSMNSVVCFYCGDSTTAMLLFPLIGRESIIALRWQQNRWKFLLHFLIVPSLQLPSFKTPISTDLPRWNLRCIKAVNPAWRKLRMMRIS